MGWTSAIPIFGKLISGINQEKLANQINPQDVTYTENPFARRQLGAVENLFNARMPGAAAGYRQIGNNMANTIANVNRNATDSSTALALAMGSQAQADDSAEKLSMQEGQQKYSLLDDLQRAHQMMINEGDKVYQDQLRKYNNDVQAKTALRKASEENYAGFGSDLTSAAMMAASGGLFGGKGSSIANPQTIPNLGQQVPISSMNNMMPLKTPPLMLSRTAPLQVSNNNKANPLLYNNNPFNWTTQLLTP